MQNPNKKISKQMHDIRPAGMGGKFDFAKKEKAVPDQSRKIFADIKRPDAITDEIRRFQKVLAEDIGEKPVVYQMGRVFENEKVPIMYAMEADTRVATRNLSPQKSEIGMVLEKYASAESFAEREEKAEFFKETIAEEAISQAKETYFDEIISADAFFDNHDEEGKRVFYLKDFLFLKDFFDPTAVKRAKLSFALISAIIFLFVFGIGFVSKGLSVKNSVLDTGKLAYADLAQAQEEMLNKNFQGSQVSFNEAYENFNQISSELDDLGGILVKAARFVPYLSKISSGSYLADAGKNVSKMGVLLGEIMNTLNNVKNPLQGGEEPVSLLKIFQDTQKNSKEVLTLLDKTQDDLSKVNVEDIPEEQRVKFSDLKNKIPQIRGFVKSFVDNGQIFTDVLGGNGPRKYLFLFQNNQEMRATGGFIGTYGVLDIFEGNIRKFFIDGIFNPDGQLKEKIVPPGPIQKISAAWSLHDSNWFPDFPVSAEVATGFYEKTGGPTVDGVITMTPEVMQKLLEVTGPIDMPEYDITIDQDNFIEKVQQEVEVDYDKELNQPKKILADLAPKILDKIFNAKDFSDIAKTMNLLMESLREKQILIYSKNYDIEKKISEMGWSGEVLGTEKDYLSVVNTNINGYKTDGVIDEKIEHKAEIQADGAVIDTVTITRHHNGGDSQFEWWNKVNSDYMRVYVPKGSQLLQVEGQTREFNAPPLDYDVLGFKRDPKVQMEEDSIKIDEENGTRIYEDAKKTVFANWVYVSPKETVTVRYKYLLPFKVELGTANKLVDTYSLLIQKQSGSVGSQLVSEISFPSGYKVNWKYPAEIVSDGNNLKTETNLKTDRFIGVAFTK